MGNLAPTRKKLRVLNKNLISTQHPQYQNPKYAPVTSVIELTIEMLAIWNFFKINVTILFICSDWNEDLDNNAMPGAYLARVLWVL
jgi:hypothetical protein